MSNCCFNHPIRIFCPLVGNCVGGNTVVNPIIQSQYAFFNNANIGTIGPQELIPVNFSLGGGDTITPSLSLPGSVNLVSGTYEISYFAEGTVPANDLLSIKLRLNGQDIPGTVVTVTQDAGNVANLTQTIILTTLQTGTLELVSNSVFHATFSSASIAIRRI